MFFFSFVFVAFRAGTVRHRRQSTKSSRDRASESVQKGLTFFPLMGVRVCVYGCGFHCRLVCLVRTEAMDDKEARRRRRRKNKRSIGKESQPELVCSIGQVMNVDAALLFSFSFSSCPLFFPLSISTSVCTLPFC